MCKPSVAPDSPTLLAAAMGARRCDPFDPVKRCWNQGQIGDLAAPGAYSCTAVRTLHQAATGRPDVPLLNLRRVVWLVRVRTCENPPIFSRYGFPSLFEQHLNERLVKRNIVAGVSGLDVIHMPAHEAALNEQLVLLEVEIVPLKRRNLAYAKTEALMPD